MVEQTPKFHRPTRFYGYGNALCVVGQPPWPPVIRNDSAHDFEELFKSIAAALNVKHRYNFLRERIEVSVKAYERGDKSKMELADDVLKMFTVIVNDERDEAPMFAEHEVSLHNYEIQNGNWGG